MNDLKPEAIKNISKVLFFNISFFKHAMFKIVHNSRQWERFSWHSDIDWCVAMAYVIEHNSKIKLKFCSDYNYSGHWIDNNASNVSSNINKKMSSHFC